MYDQSSTSNDYRRVCRITMSILGALSLWWRISKHGFNSLSSVTMLAVPFRTSWSSLSSFASGLTIFLHDSMCWTPCWTEPDGRGSSIWLHSSQCSGKIDQNLSWYSMGSYIDAEVDRGGPLKAAPAPDAAIVLGTRPIEKVGAICVGHGGHTNSL
jgi:hypothetical protein